jgi:hypothetical protein
MLADAHVRWPSRMISTQLVSKMRFCLHKFETKSAGSAAGNNYFPFSNNARCLINNSYIWTQTKLRVHSELDINPQRIA